MRYWMLIQAVLRLIDRALTAASWLICRWDWWYWYDYRVNEPGAKARAQEAMKKTFSMRGPEIAASIEKNNALLKRIKGRTLH